MFRWLLIVNILLCSSFAQQTATLPNGNKIKVYEDGTWKPVQDSIKKDSTISRIARSNSLSAFDSSCTTLIQFETDKMSGNSYYVPKSPIIVSKDRKEGLVITLMTGGKGSLVLIAKAIGAVRCIDKGQKILILFSDKSRLELASDGKFNCNARSTVYFGGSFGKESEMNELMSKRISAMRVWTNDSYVEQDFTQENANAFYYTIRCLSEHVK